MRRWACTAALLSGLVWGVPTQAMRIREPVPLERRLANDLAGRPATWWLAGSAAEPSRWLIGVSPLLAS